MQGDFDEQHDAQYHESAVMIGRYCDHPATLLAL